MAERVAFLDSFDHAGPAYRAAKYLHVRGTYTEVAGPYHGVAARFGAQGNDLGPAGHGALFDSGAWSGSVRVDATGWTGGGEVALLAPAYRDASVDFPHHWLTVDGAGTLTVRRWPIPPAPGPPATNVIATSAPGAFPLGAWVRLEYRTQIRSDSTAAGTLGVRVDGTEVLTATGLVTNDPQRAIVTADHFRFGHLEATAGDTGGVGGLLEGAEAVGVAFDDVCARYDSTLGAALLPYHDDPALPHRVVCLPPTGPGLYAELPRVGAAAANWAACAEVPPDGDATYVSKPLWDGEPDLPVDLYATAPAPTIAEGGARAWLLVWGLAAAPSGGSASQEATVRLRDGLGAECGVRLPLRAAAPTYRYAGAPLGTTPDPPTPPTPVAGPGDVLNAHLAGLQIGWGGRGTTESPLDQTFRGTQVVAELWYRPGEAPEPGAGGQRWSVGWVG